MATQQTLLDPPPAPDRAPAPAADPDRVVNVLCDKAGRIGPLSYLAPDGGIPAAGVAVEVPFGKTTKVGMVLGPGDPDKATRTICGVYGQRTTAEDIAHARMVAQRHYTSFEQLAPRLAPPSGKGAAPSDPGPVKLTPKVADADSPASWDTSTTPHRRYLLRAPLVRPAELAAREAARIAKATGSQVLILCPSATLVTATLKLFDSGACRLDSKADHGAWSGFLAGTVPVGIGARTAALYAAKQLGGIVVVEEDHPGHQEQSAPYTHARDLAISRTWAADAHLTLIGMRPTPAALGTKTRIQQVGSGDDWPAMTLLDRADLPPEQRTLPSEIITRARDAAEQGKPATVLVERLPSFRRCGRCSNVRTCDICEDVGTAQSICPHDLGPCGTCSETRVWTAGWDEARTAAAFERLRTEVKTATFPQLAHRTRAGLVTCIDIDRALNRPGFDPDAVAAPMLLAAAQAAGRGGELLVATNEPDHPLLTELFEQQDQLAGAKRAWAAARDNRLPPFATLVTVRLGGATRPDTSSWPGRVVGPRAVGGEWEALVLLEPGEEEKFAPVANQLRAAGRVRVEVT